MVSVTMALLLGVNMAFAPRASAGTPEQQLQVALTALARGDAEQSLERLDALLQEQPRFRAAQLVYADLLYALAGNLVPVEVPGATLAERPALTHELRARFSRHSDPVDRGLLPAALLQASPDQSHALLVDLGESRLYWYALSNGVPERITDYYVSSGRNGSPKRRKGDKRTPVGVYFVTGRIAAPQLNDFYGSGALPINFPNEWDLREGYTGYGIWLHGVPSSSYSRVPNASDGCVALSNEHFARLLRNTAPATTPVILARSLRWQTPAEIAADRDSLMAALESWRGDRESRDADRYTRHYAAEFMHGIVDRETWLALQAEADARRTTLQLELDLVSAYAYPDSDMAVVTFRQRLADDLGEAEQHRRQYWRRAQDGGWLIAHAEPARFRRRHLRGIPLPAQAGFELDPFTVR